ncbi:hypothetical protein AMK68_02740 [candidate division KD3-62 bacterium DG_56]|uniref:Peptidase MA-like domain-containing protein n=1 Tax=candidate division KD3-62 bacterium DG_56 TaxID=1704032 RepID=A0A0S7XNG5_9BACT|nr:MAG: hypothetical protein AMK68_02740 [candidate division KD3-62 bacterium DG_56]
MITRLTVLIMLAVVLPVPAPAQPTTPATSKQDRRIVLRYQAGDQQLAFAVGRTAGSALGEISRSLETTVPGPVVVYVYSNREAYRQATGASPKNLEIGRASAPPDVIHVDATGTLGNADRVTRHEITHVVLNHALGPALDRCPRWVQEGIARYFERPTAPLDPAVEALLRRGTKIDVDRLDDDIEAGGERGRLAYTKSEALIRWLVKEREPGVLPRLVRELRRHSDFDAALHAATGMSVKQLERGWRRSDAWIYVLSSNNVIWLLMTVLLLAAVVLVYRRRRRRRRLEQVMEEGLDEEIDQPEGGGPTIH